MPASVFNLKTHIITSEDPVVVRTQDFELTGEKMEFNTVDRTGRLLGKVRMVVHNLKQVTAQPEPSPAQE
jgi:lipopolysaccharide export system protein LptC